MVSLDLLSSVRVRSNRCSSVCIFSRFPQVVGACWEVDASSLSLFRSSTVVGEFSSRPFSSSDT